MSFVKKAWPLILTVLVVSIGAFLFGRANKPAPPVKIYKVTTPTQQQIEAPTKTEAKTDSSIVQNQGSRPATDGSLQESPDIPRTDSKEGALATEVVPSEPTSGTPVTKGAVPPELSREAMEQLQKQEELRKRSAEIWAELQTFANREISNEEFLHALDLQKEHFRIQQELGIFDKDGQDSALDFEYFRFMATHSTEDGRLPTSRAIQFLDLFERTGPNTPEHQSMLRQFRKIAHQAMENGDEYFQPRLETQ